MDRGFVQGLDSVRTDQLDRAGGKAANLGEMLNAGLPVPGGFVLLTDAYRRFFAANDPDRCLRGRLERASTDETDGALSGGEARDLFLQVRIGGVAMTPFFLRTVAGVSLMIAALCSVVSRAATANGPVSTGKPNIVLVITDDQAQWALGAYGNDEIHTPNIRPPDIALSGDERFVPLNSQSEAELGAGKGNGECIELCAQCRERRGAMWRRLAGDGYA